MSEKRFSYKKRDKSTVCACGEPRRPGQTNCLACHRQAQVEYRARVRKLLAEARVSQRTIARSREIDNEAA